MYHLEVAFKKYTLLIIGRPDELLENPAVANMYTNEEILVNYGRRRMTSVFSTNVDDVLDVII